MAGVLYTAIQPNGVTTTFATILDIRWQPGLAANVQVGFFVNEASFTTGYQPVYTQYFPLNISLIDPTQAIPPQLIAQLTAQSGPVPGGTPVA